MISVTKSNGRRWLDNHIVPEGVPIRFELASMGARFGAQALDLIITYSTILLLLFIMLWIGILDGYGAVVLVILLLFFVRAPYYICSELVWNGRTLGKRICGLRVISADGTRLTPYQITVRNLMKEAEVFLPITLLLTGRDYVWPVWLFFTAWVFGIIIFPFTNAARQRFGDMVAGTIVIDRPRPVMMPDLSHTANESAAGKFSFDLNHLDVYGRYELQVLEDILRNDPSTPKELEKVHEVAQTIMQKIDYPDRVLAADAPEFLLAFYAQQRAYLENRQLFGDARADKHSKKDAESA